VDRQYSLETLVYRSTSINQFQPHMRRAIHSIHYDDDHIRKIHEAAVNKVDHDTGVYRPHVLKHLHLHASPSPKKTRPKRTKVIQQFRFSSSSSSSALSTTPQKPNHPKKRSSKAQVRKAQIKRAHLLVQDSLDYLKQVQSDASSTAGELQLAMSMFNSQNVLLRSYQKSVESTSALEEEQKEWRYQSPSKRGVNTSPKRSWSTKRGTKISSVSGQSTHCTEQIKTRNPPAFRSDNVLLLSPRTSKRSTCRYGALISNSLPISGGKKLNF
jgi:hypothetical protein